MMLGPAARLATCPAVQVRLAVEADLEPMGAFAARQQAVPERHIGYLASDADSIRTDVLGVDEWVRWTVVVVDAVGGLAGWLLGEKDEEMDRAWWWGPFLTDEAWPVIADDLYVTAAQVVNASEEEMAPDDRNLLAAGCAQRNGFRPETASAVLSYTGGGFGSRGGTVSLGDEHGPAVVALHDRLFPGTHTLGEALVDSDDPRLVIVEDGQVVGYVAAELHSDGSGYIDYLGVDPMWGRRGFGRRLVMDATDVLLAAGATSVNLTVRDTNTPGRALYDSLGFVHERVIRPYRKGFSLDAGTDQATA